MWLIKVSAINRWPTHSTKRTSTEKMSEAAKTKMTSLAGGYINPGIGILTAWQGILEIVLRGVIVVSQSGA